MKIERIVEVVDAEVLCCEHLLGHEIMSACGSDMMSDVLAFVKDQGMLITGLLNAQVVRTAEMMDMSCILFIRGKKPEQSVIDLASGKNIVLLSSKERMYSACGKLFVAGLDSGKKI